MKKFLLVLCAMLMVFGMVGIASAVPINSNSDVALTGATIIDFESVAQGTYTSITVNDVTFSAGNNHLMIDDDWQIYNMTGVYLDNGTYANHGFQSLTVDFATDVNAFGFNWGMAEAWATWTLSAYDATDSIIDSRGLPNGSFSGEFYGLATAGISYAVIQQTSGDYDWIGIDNFTYVSSGAPVPEPSTILLMGVGLLGLVGYSRKRLIKKS